MGALTIREAVPSDRGAVVAIGRELVADGRTYVFDPQTTDDELAAYFFDPRGRTFVAERDGMVVGFFLIRPNQPGRGSHVANAAYAVAAGAGGAGIGRALGERSLEVAREMGYRAMQFNCVVSTNEPALRLWRSLGFEIAGRVPAAFRHPTEGFVDAYVMYRSLDPG